MRIRTRILLVFILTTSLGVGSLLYWLDDEMRPRYMEAQEDILVDMARVLAVLIRERGLRFDADGQAMLQTGYLQEILDEALGQPIDARIYSMHKQSVDLRIYVTDDNGIVLYDSDNGRDAGKDYANWRDVHRTLEGKYGARSTHGDPTYPEGSTMYIAAPIRLDGQLIGVVSIGKPTRNAERFKAHALGRFAEAGLYSILGAVAIGLVVYWWLSRPLQRLYHYARSVQSGKREPLPSLGDNEIGRVGEAMDAMRAALDGKSYVTDYVQSLTHELKSPAAAIRGAAELLDEDMPVDDRHRFITNIRSQIDRIQDIVDRLLALAEIESYQGLERQESVGLETIVKEACDALFPYASERQAQIHMLTAQCEAVKGDAFLLKQAIDNLLKNAIEFSPPSGEILVRLEWRDGEARVAIQDQGPGIPDYAKERVFDRFYSLARPDGHKGTGLGLSFVREIALLHGGGVVLRDGPEGSGTVAELHIPIGSGS